MLIIFGIRVIMTALGVGVFYCPRCAADAPYRRLRARRWFHIFFIPVIPLEHLGLHVECDHCHGTFVESVLVAPTLAQMEYHMGLANRAAVTHVASLATPLDGRVEERGLELLAGAAGVRAEYDRQALHADARAFAERSVAVRYVQPMADWLTIAGHEAFLRRVITMADGLPASGSADAAGAVEAFADALGITRAHLTGIRASLADPVVSPEGEA